MFACLPEAWVILNVSPSDPGRYKDAEPLTSKDSSGIAKGFEKTYSRKLRWPHTLIVDPGTEFMGDVTKLMKKHNARIQRSEAGNHRAKSFVERANRTLAVFSSVCSRND